MPAGLNRRGRGMTPFLGEIHARHKGFHAEIARRAALVPPKENRSYSIPNTPYGVNKLARPVIRPAPAPIPYRSTDNSRCMWFYNLVNFIPAVPEQLKIEFIQRVVARHYGTTKLDIISCRRTKDVLLPRQIAAYLAKTMTARSLPEIGRRFGGRDHTTMLHAVRKIKGLLEIDLELAERVRLIKVELAA